MKYITKLILFEIWFGSSMLSIAVGSMLCILIIFV